ncbi:MAG: hypothetical protein HYX87_08090 [Chloroflexi bacterium]|nr:hypothetical protein [Chloroflexota bacterium]
MRMGSVVEQKAKELAIGAGSWGEVVDRIANFVRDGILYYLDEWNVTADEVLQKGRGMCAGKALLTAGLLRANGIPARFIVLKIFGEEGLLEFVARQLEDSVSEPMPNNIRKIISGIRSLPAYSDHIIVQAVLEGQEIDLDLARDSGLDRGMRFVGAWRERKVVQKAGPFGSIDAWLAGRMGRRAVVEERQDFFNIINRQMDKLRRVGRIAGEAGIEPWTTNQVGDALREWHVMPGCPCDIGTVYKSLTKVLAACKSSLPGLAEPENRSRLESRIADWLYKVTRYNIKRGRYWELSNVLTRHSADCLGYARILSFLAVEGGLNAGIMEVIQDNRGRFVPHCVCALELSDGTKKYLDPWYGSPDIRHRLYLARVREDGKLVLKQLTPDEMDSALEVGSLSMMQIAGLSLYIIGNGYLARGMFTEAIECYHVSLWLFPTNTRTLFNRAVACERLGEKESAQTDYQQAFSLDPSIGRVIGTADDLEVLMKLDEEDVPEEDQQIYLLRKGYITGKQEGWGEVARRCHTSAAQAKLRFAAALLLIEPGRQPTGAR